MAADGGFQDYLFQFILVIATTGPFVGLALWAHAGNKNRVAGIALMIVVGIFGGVEILAGALLLLAWPAISDGSPGFATLVATVLGLGLITCLLLVPGIRRVLSRVLPTSADSVVDLAGLFVLLHVLGGSLALLIGADSIALAQQGLEDAGSLTIPGLLIESIQYPILAFFAVGIFITRGFRASVDRLGLRLPSLKYVGLALLLVVFAFATDVLFQSLMERFQPEALANMNELIETMFGDLRNPAGALAVGVTAGVGEELLLRGAIQPRFGVFLTSAVFTVIHLQYGFTFALLQIFIFSLLLGLLRMRGGTVAAMITHTVYNTTALLLATYVSGQ